MRNLRFQVMRTYGQREDSRVWAMSEFQIHSVAISEILSPYYTRTNVRNAFDALQAQLQATRQLIADGTVTPDALQALQQAIDRAEQSLQEPDGILEIGDGQEAMENKQGENALYDLAGRRIANSKSTSQPTPTGVYIHDGKKVAKAR